MKLTLLMNLLFLHEQKVKIKIFRKRKRIFYHFLRDFIEQIKQNFRVRLQNEVTTSKLKDIHIKVMLNCIFICFSIIALEIVFILIKLMEKLKVYLFLKTQHYLTQRMLMMPLSSRNSVRKIVFYWELTICFRVKN